METVKIIEVNVLYIKFTDGHIITFDHEQDCCENNYADFEQIDDIALNTEFTLPLTFEEVDGVGFKFGNPNKMFFIPCYSIQNGYYTSRVNIYFDDQEVLCIYANENTFETRAEAYGEDWF